MQVLRFFWLGTRTTAVEETTRFFDNVLQLERLPTESHFSVFAVPDGSSVEVFGPDSPHNQHLTHLVGGFLVADLDEALRELQEHGIEIVLPLQERDDRQWLHFRAPDGHVYELANPGAVVVAPPVRADGRAPPQALPLSCCWRPLG